MASVAGAKHQLTDGEDDDEVEDVDFNPFLKSPLSPEAASSVSTDIEPNYDRSDHARSPAHECQSSNDEINMNRESIERDKLILNARIRGAAREDPICSRTRARHSLKGFSLDELETFLQETDEEEEFHNADDEEEYRKFLMAVLNDGPEEVDVVVKDLSDEEDDNDADFEVEIEEALESDRDDNHDESEKAPHHGATEFHQRRAARQSRPQRRAVARRDKIFGQAKLHPRPILPSNIPNPMTFSLPLAAAAVPPQTVPISYFTTHQIGQLYCLIHEHVQLLIQVFSLCVFEHSKQHIAKEVQSLISELLHTRVEALSRRRIPYPAVCFEPPYLYSSVSECLSPPNTSMCSEQGGGRPIWIPDVREPPMSILDVPPLALAEDYLADASEAAQEYVQRYLQATEEPEKFERLPLFPSPKSSSGDENASQSPGLSCSSDQVIAAEHPPLQSKKTLAGTLVETSKKQSVALVPSNIVTLAQRFFPLFNSALYPHKPPPLPGVNRVLFTDTEDELLALGLMEYNNDWKAIQQRFLPCKTKHQIFVRAKNRVSSKAPENPIKAVRRMKTSPLSREEIALIQEGLRIFKLDWMLVWKFFVPYRDPSLLRRQWRIASGIQKSYKMDEITRAKRRVYERKRRKNIAQSSFQKHQTIMGIDGHVTSHGDDQVVSATGHAQSADDNIEDNEVYVHEALLADYAPLRSRQAPLELPLSNFCNRNLLSADAHKKLSLKNAATSDCITVQVSHYAAQHLSPDVNIKCSVSYAAAAAANQMASSSFINPVGTQYLQCKNDVSRMVRLAPDLPPVNLPPSVCVISQSSFMKTDRIFGGRNARNCKKHKNSVFTSEDLSLKAQGSFVHPNAAESDFLIHPLLFQTSKGSFVPQNAAESDFLIHPLLFQSSRIQSMNCNGTSVLTPNFSSRNLFHANHGPQGILNLCGPIGDHFHKAPLSKEASSTIDFHPLLQTDDSINDATEVSSKGKPSFDSEKMLHESEGSSDRQEKTVEHTGSGGTANELDLDIGLGSAVGGMKMAKIGAKSDNITGSKSSSPHLSVSEECAQATKDSCCPCKGMPYCQNYSDDLDQGIVMEQEELTDSDKEMEDVQFEYEEMIDSEEELGGVVHPHVVLKG